MCQFKSFIWIPTHGFFHKVGIDSHTHLSCELALSINAESASRLDDYACKFEYLPVENKLILDTIPDRYNDDREIIVDQAKDWIDKHRGEIIAEGVARGKLIGKGIDTLQAKLDNYIRADEPELFGAAIKGLKREINRIKKDNKEERKNLKLNYSKESMTVSTY